MLRCINKSTIFELLHFERNHIFTQKVVMARTEQKKKKKFKKRKMSSQDKIHVDVTLLLRGKQRLYGVRSNEYERYAQYCSRRISRLTRLLKKREGVQGMQGPSHDLSPSVNQCLEHILIVLFKADGAMARYRFLKNTAEKQGRRHHAVMRLKKCLKWWNLAIECSAAFCSERTQLEVGAFKDYAIATYELEVGNWSNALKTFTNVTDIFLSIHNASPDPTLKTFCGEILDDIAPLIEYCKFNLGQTDGQHIDAATREKIRNIYDQGTTTIGAQTLAELNWRNKTVPIVHDGLKSKMASIVDLVTDIHKERNVENMDKSEREKEAQLMMKLFDRLLMEAHSARQTIRSLSSKGESDELKFLDQYLDWNSYIATLERSRVLLDSQNTASQKADLAARTFNRISDNKSKYDGDGAIEALMHLWHALKVLYISEPLTDNKAVGLLDRAKNYAANALDIISKENINDPPGLKGWAEKISMEIRKQKIIKIGLSTGVETTIKANHSSFLEDQNSYSSCSTIVQIPPLPKPITPKGMIFNNARDDYLDYPNIDAKNAKKNWSNFLKFW